ncbi:cytochrome b [Streptomyces oceani]|nr:ubiquinol-cytochrome c reductase cytochrome b subunit [Streptomyces oceani]
MPATEGGRALLRKAFPDHWSFLLGELALYSLVVLVLTGTYLTLFFDPGMAEVVYKGRHGPLQGVLMSEAYASTVELSFDVRGGLLVRQIHHWGALVFVAALGVHMLRVFFTGAFRRPRELNWVIGVTLFLLALLEGFTGYSLPDDLLSGTGLRIAQGIITSIPVVGTYLSFFVFGGEYPGHDIVSRLYITHVLLVPGLLLALVVAHLVLVVYLKHTHWAVPGRTNRNAVGQPMVPQFAAKSTGLFFTVFGILTLLAAVAQVNPVYNYGPYRPDQVSTAAQPDWYVGFLEGSLRLMPPLETTLWGHTLMWNVLLPAVVLPALLFAALYLYPLVERWLTGDTGEHHLCDRPRNHPVRTGFGVAAVTCYAVLLMAGGNDVIAETLRVSLNRLTWIFRVGFVLGPIIAFFITRRVCVALQSADRERLLEGTETGEVYQEVDGNMQPGHTGLSAREQYVLLMRKRVEPYGQRLPVERMSRWQRLRAALSRWFVRGQVRPPATPGQQREITSRTAGPSQDEDEDEGGGGGGGKESRPTSEP